MKTWINVIGFFVLLSIFIGVGMLINASAEEKPEQQSIDTRPLISINELVPEDYEVTLVGHGEVVPLEKTTLAAQVSGEIIDWNPNFLAGGIVHKDDILFSIEKEPYHAAVLQAEAQLNLAQASLAEELARQKVAQQEAKHLPAAKISDLYLRKPQVLSAQAQVKSAQAQLQIAQRNLAKTDVRAPYDALVVEREIGLGQYVTAGTKVAQLNNIEFAEIIVPIAGFDSPFLANNMLGTEAQVKVQGASQHSRQATMVRDLGVTDKTTRMKNLVFRVTDPYAINRQTDTLSFGSYVEVKFAGKALNEVFKIPQTLVNNSRIWVVNNEAELQSQAVNIIREEGEYFLVKVNFAQTLRIADKLPEYPQNGMQVKIESEQSPLISKVD